MTFSNIQTALGSGKTTCVALVQQYMQRIAARPELNIFIETFAEDALRQAAAVDEKIAAGTAGRLAGMVLGIKDVICLANKKVSAGSNMLQGFHSQITATAIERLLAEDAVIIGRQNCDEFAMGSANETSFYGATQNPIDPTRTPGGSSGGSAAAVAAQMCTASIGSDTGGSVRQPAAHCGVVGLKPTYGRISRYGLIAYGSSFDQLGPITHSVADAALLLEIMAGSDTHDQTSATVEVPAYTAQLSALRGKKYTIGYLREAIYSPSLDDAMCDYFHQLIQQLKDDGHEVLELSFPYIDHVVPCYYVLTTAEASSNLSRYDGVRYGHRTAQAQTLEELYVRSRTEGFGEEVQKRIMLGTFVLSAGYADAYYTQAQKVRRLIANWTAEAFQHCDFMLSPTTPTPAPKLGAHFDDPIAEYLSDVYTVFANLVGCPAISLPLGKHPNGLPFGVQFMAKAFDEARLLAFSAELMGE